MTAPGARLRAVPRASACATSSGHLTAGWRRDLRALHDDQSREKMPGWGASADRAPLRPISLQTGNLAGNSCAQRPGASLDRSFRQAPHRLRPGFPADQNRDFWRDEQRIRRPEQRIVCHTFRLRGCPPRPPKKAEPGDRPIAKSALGLWRGTRHPAGRPRRASLIISCRYARRDLIRSPTPICPSNCNSMSSATIFCLGHGAQPDKNAARVDRSRAGMACRYK